MKNESPPPQETVVGGLFMVKLLFEDHGGVILGQGNGIALQSGCDGVTVSSHRQLIAALGPGSFSVQILIQG